MGMSLYIVREHIDTGYEMETMVTMVLMKPSKIRKARSYDANASRFCEIYKTKTKSTNKNAKTRMNLGRKNLKPFVSFFGLL